MSWVKLTNYLSKLPNAIVAYSGGVDSTVLLFAVREALGDKMAAVTGESHTLPIHDRLDAIEFCKKHKIRHIFVKTGEMEDTNFISNPVDRCYLCKKGLYSTLSRFAEGQGYAYILEGTNTTELKGLRPGYEASLEFKNVLVPFVDLKISKDEIRRMAKEKDLGVWDRPSSACLASRIPTGVKITKEVLRRIDNAEEILRKKISGQVRVRDCGDTARIEVDPQEFHALVEVREEIIKELTKLGYKFITLDIKGYRMGGASL